MTLGAINHLALTVTDLDAAERAFWQPVLAFLGYRRAESHPGLAVWVAPATGIAVNLWQARPETADHEHLRHAPGLHHVAFDADDREQVDAFHAMLLRIRATVLDPPATYDYAPGYYAVYAADPDGLKVELAHVPGLGLHCEARGA